MIDWDRIDDLKSEIGQTDFVEIFDLFLAEVEECLSSLTSCASATSSTINNGSTVHENLHFLRGSALNLGFTDLADLCSAGETAVRTGQSFELKTLQTCFAKSKAFFNQNAP